MRTFLMCSAFCSGPCWWVTREIKANLERGTALPEH